MEKVRHFTYKGVRYSASLEQLEADAEHSERWQVNTHQPGDPMPVHFATDLTEAAAFKRSRDYVRGSR